MSVTFYRYAYAPSRWTLGVPVRFGAAVDQADVRDCMQCRGFSCTAFGMNGGPFRLSETDCLFVKVVVPTEEHEKTREDGALVFVFGGGGNSGSISSPINIQESLSRHTNMVSFGFSYRLGIFGTGFPFANRSQIKYYGSADQDMAMEWVVTNAAHFGVDPGKLVGVGHSSGASDTMRLALQQPSLFTRVILLGYRGWASSHCNDGYFSRVLACATCDTEETCREVDSSVMAKCMGSAGLVRLSPATSHISSTPPLPIFSPLLLVAAENDAAIVLTSNPISFMRTVYEHFLAEDIEHAYERHGRLFKSNSLRKYINDILYTCPFHRMQSPLLYKTRLRGITPLSLAYMTTGTHLTEAANLMPLLPSTLSDLPYSIFKSSPIFQQNYKEHIANFIREDISMLHRYTEIGTFRVTSSNTDEENDRV